jgi:hypothetical protein
MDLPGTLQGVGHIPIRRDILRLNDIFDFPEYERSPEAPLTWLN